jgi:hypothetical protein
MLGQDSPSVHMKPHGHYRAGNHVSQR